jgi:hypothetical protein
MKRFIMLLLAAAPVLWPVPASSRAGVFSLTELDAGEGCGITDPARLEILKALAASTSVDPDPAVKKIRLSDPALFGEPFVVLSCSKAPGALDYAEARNLRLYLSAGGTLFANDSSGLRKSPFAAWLSRAVELTLPGLPLKPADRNHPVFKSFFMSLLPGGRFDLEREPSVVEYSGRYAVIFSRNDLIGVWARDALGRYLYEPSPGGARQRREGEKLTLNILIYALTGSYKQDAVHQPYIMQRLRELDAGRGPR